MHKRPERPHRRPERYAARRRLKPEVRRAELIQAALGVLHSHDPSEVKVEDVTKAAGAAKGTFYVYFSSWNEFLVAVRDHVLSEQTTELMDRFAGVGTADQWWTAVEEECESFVDFHLKLGNIHRAVFHGPAGEYPLNVEHSPARIISRLLRQGMALGACREMDAELAAPLVFALLHETTDGVVKSGAREERIETLLCVLRAWFRVPEREAKN